MDNIPRGEYPRPNFKREHWLPLNGTWKFSFDDAKLDKEITVPYVYQCELSGIGTKEFHENLWYEKGFVLPASMHGRRIHLHFGAVDYISRIWVNDIFIGEHTGGQTGFCFDITEAIRPDAENIVRLKAYDPSFDIDIPRGKQFWEAESRSIFYTPSSGIWQSVWIEAVSENHIKNVYIIPMLDEQSVKFEYDLGGNARSTLDIDISYEGRFITGVSVAPQGLSGSVTVKLNQSNLNAWNFIEDFTWSPENPRLFDVCYILKNGGHVEDAVDSYFGMRKVSVANGVFMLNNRPYYQRLVLDQGYWQKSLLTAPTDEDFVKDIALVKQMGFNGVRKHQKVEDPRYLYHADKMGLLVWGEIGSAYAYTRRYAQNMALEWMEAVKRDYNHPCIIVWTPLNESWGIQEVNTDTSVNGHCKAMYHLTKSLDATRLVISNDGWEHTDSDLLTIHDYDWREEVLQKRYESIESILRSMPAGRALYATGSDYSDQPILLTEFGGILFKCDETENKEDWGYSAAVNKEDFLERYRAVIAPLYKSPHIQGFCYTQFTDVEQEINGLLTYTREPKVDMEDIFKITTGKHL